MHDDVAAIEAVKSGERHRYGELVERHQGLVYAIAWSRLGDAALSEDAVQETFVQAYRFLAGLRKPERFSSWIAAIARNVSSAMLRRRHNELEAVHRWQLERSARLEPNASAALPPLTETLPDAMSQLPDTHREALVMFYIEGESVRECAERLGVREEAFKMRLSRARASLRGILEQQLEESLPRVRPSRKVTQKVMAALPASPIGLAGGPLAVFFVSLVIPLLVNCATALTLTTIHARSLVRNLRDPRDAQHKLIWRDALMMALIIAVSVTIVNFLLIRHIAGTRLVFAFVGMDALAGLVCSIRNVRVNRSPFALALAAFFAILLACSVPIVIFELYLGAFGMIAGLGFLAAMLPVLFTQKYANWRSDLSLFLRACTGGLARASSPRPSDESAPPELLWKFARFLGRMSLVEDCSVRRGSFVLYLPPVGTRWVTHFGIRGRLALPSSVTIRQDGTCHAKICDHDWRALQSLLPQTARTRQEIEEQVTGVVTGALDRFRAGDLKESGLLVQAKPDAAVLRKPVHTLRVRWLLIIIGLAPMVLLVLYRLIRLLVR